MSVDQAKNEKVDIRLKDEISFPIYKVFACSQDSPQSNSIHIGHNNPVGSDIKIKQTKPFNTSVHISLNVGKDSKVSSLNALGLFDHNEIALKIDNTIVLWL